jgi:hypothetical protein
MKSNRDGKHQRQPQRQRKGEMAADRLALKERSA